MYQELAVIMNLPFEIARSGRYFFTVFGDSTAFSHHYFDELIDVLIQSRVEFVSGFVLCEREGVPVIQLYRVQNIEKDFHDFRLGRFSSFSSFRHAYTVSSHLNASACQ
jgi:hypothetical protein